MKVKIGDICTLKSGTSLKEDVLNESNGIPYIKVSDMNLVGNEKYIVRANSYADESINEKMLFPKGTVLFPKRGGAIGTNKKRIASKTVCADLNTMGVIPSDKISPLYLYYFFQNIDFATLYNGSSVPQINNTDIAPMEINLISLEEQDNIVTLLEKIDDIVRKRKKELSALDNLIKARFVELFGDPVMNEKGWITKSLLDMGRCKNGMNFHYDDEGVEINCLGVGDFKELSIIDNTDELPTVSLKEMPSEEYLLKDDDIVFVRSNGNKALVGRSIAVYPGNVPTTFSGFCIRYRKHDNEIIVPYLLRALKADSMRMKMTGRGANIQNLNQQILGTLVIPVPPIELQNQFADFVKQVDKSKVKVQKALDETQKLFDSLMQQYFG